MSNHSSDTQKASSLLKRMRRWFTSEEPDPTLATPTEQTAQQTGTERSPAQGQNATHDSAAKLPLKAPVPVAPVPEQTSTPEHGTAPATQATPEAPAAAVSVSPDMLKTIEQQLRELQQKIEQIGSTPPPPSPSSTPSITISDVETAVQNGVETAVQNGLAGLEKQISRSGREQLKANTLSETQLERLSAALDALRENEATREKDMEALRQQIDESRAQGRLEMAQAILPALDSIDEALRSGQAVLAKPNEPQQTPTIFDRLRGQVPAKPGSDRSLREAINSWLVGLTFVQQRLFDILQAEGIHPIETNEKPFDPQVHVVIDVVPASTEHPAGMVVNELRRGYLVGTRVLRHAEVVVAKPDNEMSFEKQ